jgi:hypothetical protein
MTTELNGVTTHVRPGQVSGDENDDMAATSYLLAMAVMALWAAAPLWCTSLFDHEVGRTSHVNGAQHLLMHADVVEATGITWE